MTTISTEDLSNQANKKNNIEIYRNIEKTSVTDADEQVDRGKMKENIVDIIISSERVCDRSASGIMHKHPGWWRRKIGKGRSGFFRAIVAG